jgi:hypothetical protein
MKAKVLNSDQYRIAPSFVLEINPVITLETIDFWIDRGLIQTKMANGRWWNIRRNGATKRWRRDPNRIRIPYKYGLRGYHAITETDFVQVD